MLCCNLFHLNVTIRNNNFLQMKIDIIKRERGYDNASHLSEFITSPRILNYAKSSKRFSCFPTRTHYEFLLNNLLLVANIDEITSGI